MLNVKTVKLGLVTIQVDQYINQKNDLSEKSKGSRKIEYTYSKVYQFCEIN